MDYSCLIDVPFIQTNVSMEFTVLWFVLILEEISFPFIISCSVHSFRHFSLRLLIFSNCLVILSCQFMFMNKGPANMGSWCGTFHHWVGFFSETGLSSNRCTDCCSVDMGTGFQRPTSSYIIHDLIRIKLSPHL